MNLVRGGASSSPASLFAGGEQGVWYDPSDLSTLFQDSAGTTPVTAAGQTVGRILDKSGRGNHATQATLAQRPTYGINPITGTRNLLTYTEQFDNAAWTKLNANITVAANTITAPDGTLTADTGTISVGGTDSGLLQAKAIANNSNAYTTSFYVKRPASENGFRIDTRFTGGATAIVYAIAVNWSTLAIVTVFGAIAPSATSITAVGNDWYRVTMTCANNSTGNINCNVIIYPSTAATGITIQTGSIYVWGAQFEQSATATAYQKVVSQYEVTEAGVASVSYLSFDGVDDGMVTGTITPATDKVQVFTGIRKLSDAATGIIIETSVSVAANAGSILLRADASPPTYSFRTVGSLFAAALTTPSTYVSPITNVLTGISEIATDTALLRVNGTQIVSSSADQGTGNYLAYPLYIGRRGGTTLPFNGRLYSLITRFGPNLTTGQITATESWVNGETGAY